MLLQKEFLSLFKEKHSEETIPWINDKKTLLYINQNIEKVPIKALILAINLIKKLNKG